jgi:hypothetical protein
MTGKQGRASVSHDAGRITHLKAFMGRLEASYTAIHQVLSNPVYAGAYAYGKTRQEVTLDASGRRKKRMRHLPQSEWQVTDQGSP